MPSRGIVSGSRQRVGCGIGNVQVRRDVQRRPHAGIREAAHRGEVMHVVIRLNGRCRAIQGKDEREQPDDHPDSQVRRDESGIELPVCTLARTERDAFPARDEQEEAVGRKRHNRHGKPHRQSSRSHAEKEIHDPQDGIRQDRKEGCAGQRSQSPHTKGSPSEKARPIQHRSPCQNSQAKINPHANSPAIPRQADGNTVSDERHLQG